MKLGYIIIYVTDVPKTVAFYEKAFGLKTRFMLETNQYAEMETGGTALAFVNEEFVKDSHSFRPTRKNELSPGVEIGLVVDDVEKAFQTAIAAGATVVSKPEKKPWGQTVSYVSDNNGFLVEICSPMA